jgi:hypothetical protein
MSNTSDGDPAEGRPESVTFQTPALNARRRPRSGSLPTPPELREAAHTRDGRDSPSNRELGRPLAPSPFDEGQQPSEPYVYHRRSTREQILQEPLEALQIRNDELERRVQERPAPRPSTSLETITMGNFALVDLNAQPLALALVITTKHHLHPR